MVTRSNEELLDLAEQTEKCEMYVFFSEIGPVNPKLFENQGGIFLAREARALHLLFYFPVPFSQNFVLFCNFHVCLFKYSKV